MTPAQLDALLQAERRAHGEPAASPAGEMSDLEFTRRMAATARKQSA